MLVPRIVSIARPKRALALLVALASLMAVGTAATANVNVTRTFSGTTSQALPLSFTVQGGGGSFAITDMSFNTQLTCADGQVIAAGHGFSGFNIPIDHGQFQFDYVNVFFALHWKGRVGPNAASGTLTDLYPALTVDEQAQLCPTGELTWTAAPSTDHVAAQPRVDVRITTTRDSSGHVTTTVTRSG